MRKNRISLCKFTLTKKGGAIQDFSGRIWRFLDKPTDWEERDRQPKEADSERFFKVRRSMISPSKKKMVVTYSTLIPLRINCEEEDKVCLSTFVDEFNNLIPELNPPKSN